MEKHSEDRFSCNLCHRDRRGHGPEHPWEGAWKTMPNPSGEELLRTIYKVVREKTGRPYLAHGITQRLSVELGIPFFTWPESK